MKNKFLLGLCCSVAFACIFSSSVKAMEDDEDYTFTPSTKNSWKAEDTEKVYKDVCSKANPGRSDFEQKSIEGADELAKRCFLSNSPARMTDTYASYLINWAPKTTLEELLNLKDNNSKLLKQHCLEGIKQFGPNMTHARNKNCFELVEHLSSKKLNIITNEEKDEFMRRFAYKEPEEILHYCKNGQYIKFFQENQETLLEGITQCYIAPKKEAAFWIAVTDYIKPSLSEKQWKSAANVFLTVATYFESGDLRGKYAARALSCFEKANISSGDDYNQAYRLASRQ